MGYATNVNVCTWNDYVYASTFACRFENVPIEMATSWNTFNRKIGESTRAQQLLLSTHKAEATEEEEKTHQKETESVCCPCFILKFINVVSEWLFNFKSLIKLKLLMKNGDGKKAIEMDLNDIQQYGTDNKITCVEVVLNANDAENIFPFWFFESFFFFCSSSSFWLMSWW